MSEVKLRDYIFDIWFFNKNRWNRKFESKVMKLNEWEKYCYMENGYEDEDGEIIRWRDSY